MSFHIVRVPVSYYILEQSAGAVASTARRVLTIALLCACAGPLSAQVSPPAVPVYQVSDFNDVNLTSGSPYFHLTDITTGSMERPFARTVHSTGANMGTSLDSYHGELRDNGEYIWVGTQPYPAYAMDYGGNSELFYKNGTTWVSVTGRGSTLVTNADTTTTYTTSDGTVITLEKLQDCCREGLVTRVRSPDGLETRIHYKVVALDATNYGSRRQSVTRSDGFQLKYNYAQNTAPTSATFFTWRKLVSTVAINNAYEYCDPMADTCSLTLSWPTATYATTTPPSGQGSIITITDQNSRVTRYTLDTSNRVTGIKWPSSASADNIAYTYCSGGISCSTTDQGGTTYFDNMVMFVVRDGQTWTYNYQPGSGFSNSYYSSTGPDGSFKRATLAASYAPFTTFVSPLQSVLTDTEIAYSNPTNYTGRITAVASAGGAMTYYTYDSRGNVTNITRNANTGDPQLVLRADYSVSCANPVTCNRANWAQDAQSNQTDYTYDPVHGGVLTVTSPAVNAVRAQIRTSYTQRYAWTKNASGGYVQSATPIWMRTQESKCRTSAWNGSACVTAGDEVITIYDYGPNSGPNNLFLRGVAVSGDGQTLRSCFAYDRYGNRISETRPNAGLASCP